MDTKSLISKPFYKINQANSNAKTNASSTKNNIMSSFSSSSSLEKFVFMKFCQPAKIYVIIAFITLLYFVSIEQSLIWLIIKAIIFIGWAFILNKLCTSGNKAIAWLFAIVPQCIFLLITVRSSSSSAMAPAPIALSTTT